MDYGDEGGTLHTFVTSTTICLVLTIVRPQIAPAFAGGQSGIPVMPLPVSSTSGASVATLNPTLTLENESFVICDTASIIQTDDWTDFGGTSCTIDGVPLPSGSLVQIWDPQGNLCGERTVQTPGVYTVISAFGDDPVTSIDEGFILGDTVRFTVDCIPAQPIGPSRPIWTGKGPIKVVNLSVSTDNLDSLQYRFEVSQDSSFGASVPFEIPAALTRYTHLSIPQQLIENEQYFWRVRAQNIYGESAFSRTMHFFVDAYNSAPTPFSLEAPPNELLPPLASNLVDFEWQPSYDPDPMSAVRYDFFLSQNEPTNIIMVTPTIAEPHLHLPLELEWGNRYFWSVQANDTEGGITWAIEQFTFAVMLRGDADANNRIDIGDAVYLVNYIFAGGAMPLPRQAGDSNCDGKINITDAVVLINYIFADGPAPCSS